MFRISFDALGLERQKEEQCACPTVSRIFKFNGSINADDVTRMNLIGCK